MSRFFFGGEDPNVFCTKPESILYCMLLVCTYFGMITPLRDALPTYDLSETVFYDSGKKLLKSLKKVSRHVFISTLTFHMSHILIYV